MNTAIIDTVRKRLTESIDGKVLAASAHFFKEGEQAKVYGVRMGEVSGIAKESMEIATTMMMDRDDMVQKGYGWMLKAASEAHCNEIFDFVTKHRSAMPRTAYRYALEKMPKDMRTEAMKK